jgi:phosphoglycolate phosphatase
VAIKKRKNQNCRLSECYRLFIFDLDGTLVDSLADIAFAVNVVRKRHKLSALSNEKVRVLIGDGAPKLIERSLPRLPKRLNPEVVKEFRDIYRKHILDTTETYPYMRPLLKKLKGHKAVISNKPELLSKDIIKGLGLKKYFAVVWGGDTHPTRKPHPDPIHQLLKKLKIKPEDAVMIGDGENDVMAAKAAGVASVAVGYGFTEPKYLRKLNPDYFALSSKELYKLF